MPIDSFAPLLYPGFALRRRHSKSQCSVGTTREAAVYSVSCSIDAECDARICFRRWVKIDKRIGNSAPCNRKRTPALKLDTPNVRILTPGFTDDLQDTDDARKTASVHIGAKKTASGHLLSSRLKNEAARFRIFQGQNFHLFLTVEITR